MGKPVNRQIRKTSPSPEHTNLIIRPVTSADLPALEWDGEFVRYRRMYAGLYPQTQSGQACMWLIESQQGELIGQAFVMLKSSDTDSADGDQRAYLFAFRVKPAWRNQGVGTQLMNFIETDLKRRGFAFVTLNVARDNPDARRLYERLGYRVIGTRPGVWSYRDHEGRIQQVIEPAWRMLKRLTPGE